MKTKWWDCSNPYYFVDQYDQPISEEEAKERIKMSRKEELEKQLAEAKKAEQALIEKIADCMNLPDNRKAQWYNAVVPLLKRVVEEQIKGVKTEGGWPTIHRQIGEKCFKELLGENWQELLDKV